MLDPSLNYVGTKARVKFNEDCLKQEKTSFDHGRVVNIYIFCEINRSVNISSFPTLKSFLFGAVTLARYVEIDLCKYSG